MCVRKSISRQVGHHSKTRQGSRQAPDESMRRRHKHNHWKAAHKEELHKKHARQHHKHELEKPAGPHRRDVPNSKKTSSRSVPILMPSNYKDSIRYGHITLEESLQHDHIRAHSRIEETNNVCAGLKFTSPCMPIVLLSANLSKLH